MKVYDRLKRPLTDLRISVIDQCNFRCPYCLPADRFPENYPFLRSDKWLSFDGITRVVEAMLPLGLAKVKLTGGEPLMRPFLPDLVASLRSLDPGLEIDLITNGYHLKPLLSRFRDAGLNRITVSLDALEADLFGRMSGRGHRVDRVLDAVEEAHLRGFSPVKINAVLLKGVNDGEIESLAEYFHRPGFILRFIEYMDVGTVNGWKAGDVVPSDEVLARLKKRWDLVPLSPTHAGETAERWAYADGSTEIGLISSVSKPFCGDCSRARLSADGSIYTCLFSNSGINVRAGAESRNDAGAESSILQDTIRGIWRRRDDRYSELRSLDRNTAGSGRLDKKTSPDRIEMFAIGG